MKRFFCLLCILLGMISLLVVEPSKADSEVNYKIKRLTSQLYNRSEAMDAQRLLVSFGPEALKYVVPLLEDKKSESVRVAVLRIIADIGDPSAEDDVVNVLGDSAYRVRQEAARTLSVIGKKKTTVEPLKKLIRDYNPNVRYYAVKALSVLAGVEEKDLFLAALSDYDPRTRVAAVIALGRLKVQEAVPYLAQMVRDYEPAVRMEVAKALELIGSETCVQPLVWLLSDPDVNIRVQAIDTLNTMNFPIADEQIALAADSDDPRVASRSIEALGMRNSSRALEVARSHVDSEHMAVKLAALGVISKLGGKEEKVLLENLRDAEATAVRKKAGEALAEVDTRV